MKTCILLGVLVDLVLCRDFYIGMFKKNDFLVAQDRFYKEKVPFNYAYGKYGRVFKCPITYVRIADRLGLRRGPTVQIIRGGLQKNYIVLRLISPYNTPISVNVYVGCSSVKKKKTLPPEPPSDEHIIKEVNVEEEDITTGRSNGIVRNDVTGESTAPMDNEVTTGNENGASNDTAVTSANEATAV